MVQYKAHILLVDTKPKCFDDMELVLCNSKTSTEEHTNRGAHHFDFPRAPQVVQFLLRLIVDLCMVHARLDPTLALSVQICSDTLRVLHKKSKK